MGTKISSSNGIEYLPKIRFSGFPFEWEDCVLSTVLAERKEYCEKDGTYEHATLSKDGIYGKTERYNRDFLVSDENKAYKITHRWDLCYNPANLKFGVICLNTYGDAIFSPIYVTFDISESFSKEFIGYALSRWDFINRALRFQQGTVYERMAVSPEDFLTIHCRFPKLKEQEKIADFLRLIDQRIAKQSEHVEHLKKYKRGVVKTLLDPKQNKRNGVVWETDTIGNLGTFIKGAALSKADISDTGTPFILYGELYTTYKEVVRAIVRTTQASVDDVYLSRVGDVVVPTSGETPEEISTASCIMVPDVILAGDLNIYRSTIIDGRIMSYLLNHIVNDQIARVAQGKSVVHVQASEIGKISITYPDHKEQERIAQILELLDNRIAISEMSLNSMQEMKKALLQQLFI